MTAVVNVLHNSPAKQCECCDAGQYVRTHETQRFPYGEGEKRVELSAVIPVWKCDACDDQFTDHEAEDARHAAVCEHLQRLTPDQLIGLRQRYSMSQEAWAEHIQVGIASIKRWETGSLIQGASTDSYLRLLNDSIGHARHVAIQNSLRAPEPPAFRSDFSDSERAEARSFQLRLRA